MRPTFDSIRIYLTKRQTAAQQRRGELAKATSHKAQRLADAAGQAVDVCTDAGDYLCSLVPSTAVR